MNRTLRKICLAGVTLAALAQAAHAEDFRIRDIVVAQPFATPSIPGAMSGGAYLHLENQGTTADRLIGAASPRAKHVEIHNMSMDGGIMRMREVGGIDLPPGAKVTMRPRGGYHLMLLDLVGPLKEGESLPLTLQFEKAGTVQVRARVQSTPPTPGMGAMDHDGHKMQ